MNLEEGQKGLNQGMYYTSQKLRQTQWRYQIKLCMSRESCRNDILEDLLACGEI